MKKYAYIVDNRVHNILDEFTPEFQDIPFEERYSKDITDNCVVCDDTIHEGMDYDWNTGKFSEHIE